MVRMSPEKQAYRKRLRLGLTEKYRKQADLVRLLGIPSLEITEEIKALRKELKDIDAQSVGNDFEDKKTAKRKKAPWRCSSPLCRKIIPAADKIMHKKRHYCSNECALRDTGIIPEFLGNGQESKGSVEDG